MITDHPVSTLVGQPCEDNSFDAVTYKIELIAAIEEARAEIARGEFITHEELEKEFYSWFTE
ncbi:MAG: hypothetical protein A3F67_04140 [Verrucomicrobia bacterium RIFCSPHIGHO2_12_FULL_41_10]|nr:MAG: hypothetical protein A3F67_04140 [Verrucomicrobia bacterium RIFCSPHIGHO2_12_FULL_41_10]HLB33212.1 hypothetical protein [Chthoniobacterales bacterium]